ncbi:hypothetical protein [Tenacibaculum sp. C7A-26P2]|uniref:hypothetical protein n=1 Tax=Tenacibaculum sp. C7A-26P2 TaxID=3447504 RepID=UPI003F85AF52
MYSDKSPDILSRRIKWHAPLGEYATILNPEITAGENDKAYQDAHKLVTIENIHSTQPNSKISKEDFNIYLKRLNKACVDKVLEDVFDLNTSIDNTKNYDSLIEANQSIFDTSLKHYMSIQVIQGMMTSVRQNGNERSLKDSYPHLKVELVGSKNDKGKVLSVGVDFIYQKSIEAVKNVLFPKKNEQPKVEFIDF